ncbi:hypothetical protein ACJIZ3_025457 [Penstemon smallii]|uniref:Phytocyanin domain-containing protein n=1 Tax=Penstemon smallii TaxID=265156 RepID=A0ABD3TW09_9LAMI
MKHENMAAASFACLYIATVLLLLILPITTSTSTSPSPLAEDDEFKVGWRQPAPNETEMYSQWATTKTFHVGDSLRFEYKNDSVMVVDKWGYYHCNSSHPVSVFKDGRNTLIKLERPGPLYFVSGDPEHCKNGQRLMVEVITLHPRSPMDASPAPSPFSNAPSLLVVPQILAPFYYYVLLFNN